MSTRSRIGIIRSRNASGTQVESIYCHYDGYATGVGATLRDYWATEAKVNELLALGDLSSLGTEIGEQHDFDTHLGLNYYDAVIKGGMTEEQYEEARKADPSAQDKGWCLFYARDRGEQNVGSVTHPITKWPDYGQEAEYLFDPLTSGWFAKSETLNPVGWNTITQWDGWIPVAEAIAADEAEQAAWQAEQAAKAK